MSGDRIRLEVKERDELGSPATRRLRKQGFVPGVLYGKGDPRPIAVLERDLRGALTGASGLHAILDVVLEGQKSVHPSILKDYQRDPVRGKLAHVDLQEVRLDQPIHATVTVVLVGEAPGAKAGGVLAQVLREVSVEALPTQVPEHIDLDVSALGLGDSLRVGDLVAPEGVTLLDDPDTVIASVTAPTREVEPDETAEEAADAAGGAPDAEQAPESASGEPAGDDAAGEPGTVEG